MLDEGEISRLDHYSKRIAGQTQFGMAERWSAPVAIYDSPTGFDEKSWGGPSSESMLAWCMHNETVTCEWGAKRGQPVTHRGSVTLLPAGAPDHFLHRGAIRFAQFVIGQPLLAHVASALSSGGVTLREDLLTIDDAPLFRHARDYATRASVLPTRLEMEARAILVVECLLTRHHDLKPASEAPFVDWRIRRAIDYLEARLAEDFGLAELAAAINLSANHLTTLFRAGTGEPPHRWLMRRRFERACELLADQRRSITEVAHACGFASSQHLATVFRRRLDITPSAWRRERMS